MKTAKIALIGVVACTVPIAAGLLNRTLRAPSDGARTFVAGPSCAEANTDSRPAQDQLKLAGVSTGDLPASGPTNAPVTVTVFSDFECPYCARFAAMMRKEVMPAEAQHVRLVFRQFPLPMHPWAQAAAEASACAYQQKNDYFWTFHDFFFEHQRELTPGNLPAKVTGLARAIPGLNRARFESCLSKGETKAAIEREVAFGNANGIHATPTVFLNGKQARVGDAGQMLSLVRRLAEDPQSPVPPPESAPARSPRTHKIAGVAKGDFPALGPANAPVTLTVFSDFQCPHCARFANMMRKEVLPIAGRRLRLVFRFFPLSTHPWARTSAEAAACAYQQGNEYFWSFHDFFFEHQRDLTLAALHRLILDHARAIQGLDQAQFRKCLEQGSAKALIERDVAFGNANGIEAAPSAFLDGKETEIVAAEQLLTLIQELSPGPSLTHGAEPGTRE